MKKWIQAIVIVSALIALTIGPAAASTSWEYRETKDDIAIYTRPVSGSRVPMVKAIAVVATSPQRVWKLISRGNLRVDGLKERRILGACGENCEYLYVRFGNWMITDRHYVIRIRNESAQKNGGVRYIRSWAKTAERKLPDIHAIDVKQISGSWIMEPLDGGAKTRLTYINHLDLGGNVPPILFTPRFIDKTFDIVRVIRQMAPRALAE